jgi:hypothetical protein
MWEGSRPTSFSTQQKKIDFLSFNSRVYVSKSKKLSGFPKDYSIIVGLDIRYGATKR